MEEIKSTYEKLGRIHGKTCGIAKKLLEQEHKQSKKEYEILKKLEIAELLSKSMDIHKVLQELGVQDKRIPINEMQSIIKKYESDKGTYLRIIESVGGVYILTCARPESSDCLYIGAKEYVSEKIENINGIKLEIMTKGYDVIEDLVCRSILVNKIIVNNDNSSYIANMNSANINSTNCGHIICGHINCDTCVGAIGNSIENQTINDTKYKTSYDCSSSSDEPEYIKKKSPNYEARAISTISKKNYEDSLRLLKERHNIDTDKYTDSKYVLEYLESKPKSEISLPLRKRYINGIHWYLRCQPIKDESIKQAIKDYSRENDRIQKKYEKFVNCGKVTERQKNAGIPINELKFLVEKSKSKSNPEDYLMMKLYLEYPRRLDLLTIIYIDKIEDKIEKGNYYIMNDAVLIFETFKNAKNVKIEDKIFKLNDEINNLLVDFVKNNEKHVGDRIFNNVGTNGSKYVKKVFERNIGKGISVNDLRHITASKDYATIDELKDCARNQSHTMEMHLKYRKNYSF